MTYPMPRRSFTASVWAMSRPSTKILPDVGVIIRLIMRIDVVLPHPDGPTNTVNDSASMVRSRRSTAVVPSGYCLVTPSKVIT